MRSTTPHRLRVRPFGHFLRQPLLGRLLQIFVGVAEPADKAASDFERLTDRLDPGRRPVVTTDAKWSWSEPDAVKDTLALYTGQ